MVQASASVSLALLMGKQAIAFGALADSSGFGV